MNMTLVFDKELEQVREYQKNFEYFRDNYDELYGKFKNEFVAVKNKQVYHDRDLDSLLTFLKKENIELPKIFIEFIKEQEIIYI